MLLCFSLFSLIPMVFKLISLSFSLFFLSLAFLLISIKELKDHCEIILYLLHFSFAFLPLSFAFLPISLKSLKHFGTKRVEYAESNRGIHLFVVFHRQLLSRYSEHKQRQTI